MRIVNARTGHTLAEGAGLAESLRSRLVGLIGRDRLAEGEALVIPACRQVHTCFVRFPIDVLFINSRDVVVRAEKHLGPFRLSCYSPSARRAVELPAGTIAASQTAVGDRLLFLPALGCSGSSAS